MRIPKYPEPSRDEPLHVKPRAVRIPKYLEPSGDEPPYVKPRARRLANNPDSAAQGESRAGRVAKTTHAPAYAAASRDEEEESPWPPGPRRATLLKEGRAASRSPPPARARPVRQRATSTQTKGVRSPRRSVLVPTEAGLLWGLLYDLLCAPVWLVGLLLGRAKVGDALRPLDRLQQFALSARMTALLIALNLLVFAVELYTRYAGWSRAAFVAYFTLSTDGLGRGEHLPLLTHFFSHASLMHLGGNMLALFVFGRVVERNLGPWRLLSFYLLAAVCSTALSLLAQGLSGRSVPTLGASGAVAGLVALGILLEPLTITFEALVPMPLFLVGWLAIAADFAALLGPGGAADPVDHPAHLGGYLSVLLGYHALKRQHQAQARLGLVINLATLLLMAGLWLFWGSRAG